MYQLLNKLRQYIAPENANKHSEHELEKAAIQIRTAQYAVLCFSIYELVSGDLLSATFMLAISAYFEKMSAYYHERIIQDKQTAQYILRNYSKLSQLTDILQPKAQELRRVLREELAMKPRNNPR